MKRFLIISYSLDSGWSLVAWSRSWRLARKHFDLLCVSCQGVYDDLLFFELLDGGLLALNWSAALELR